MELAVMNQPVVAKELKTVEKNQINQYLALPKEVTIKLRSEAEKNPAFSAMCHVWAMRERSRKQVTLRNLHFKMIAEGFKFERGEYARSLRFLSALGIGKLDTDVKGHLRSLKDINTSLQHLAIAALSKGETAPKAAAPKAVAQKVQRTLTVKPKAEVKTIKNTATITLSALDKSVTIDLPVEVANKYLFEIMASLKNA